MLSIHREPQGYLLLPALLCWGESVFDGIGEPLELSFMLALAYFSVFPRTISPLKTSLAPTTYEEARMFLRVKLIGPLMLARLFDRTPLPLPAIVGQTYDNALSQSRDTYMRLTSSFRYFE